MADLMFAPIWFMLSWLIRQVENGIDGEPDENNEFEAAGPDAAQQGADQGMIANEDPYEPIVQLIKIGIAAFSVLLLGLSISAYKKTAFKGIIYAAIAFGLFAAQLFFDYAEDAIEGWEQPFNDVIFYAMTLAILVLFFMAIIRRK